MTQTVERRPLSHPAPPARRAASSVLLPGSIAAGWSLVAGLVMFGLPVLLSWATDSRSGSGSSAALATVGQIWLLAHGTALTFPGGTVHLVPLGLTLIPLLLLHRAGRHGVRTSEISGLVRAAQLVLAIAVPYALAAAVIAAASATKEITPAPWEALGGAFAVALVGGGSGVLRESHLTGLVAGLPLQVRALARASFLGSFVLLAGGALLAGVTVLAHAGRVTTLASATDPGVVGGFALALLGISLVPNAAIWGMAWTVGPGFAVGAGTSVSPWSTSLGAVPAFPLLGGLPSHPAPVWLALLGLLVPLAAGALGGVVIGRASDGSLVRAAGEGALLAPCVGLLAAGLALLSGGPLGNGRLSAVGPSAWQVGLLVAAEVLVPAALGAGVTRWRKA